MSNEPSKPTWKNFLWRLFAVVFATTVVIVISQPAFWPGGIGFGKEQAVTTTTVEKDRHGNITKSIETTKIDDGKTLWDWLSLLGVPASLAVLGYGLQQMQQQRAEEAAKALRERDEKAAKALRERDEKAAQELRDLAADETKEEVLQVFFDRVSVLLVEKNLLAISDRVNTAEIEKTEGHLKCKATDEERELLDSAVDVIRARTLSILERFENDAKRKTSVIRFLIEADFVSKLKLNLSGADLSGVAFNRADLKGANLSDTNLNDVDFNRSDLRDANLKGASPD